MPRRSAYFAAAVAVAALMLWKPFAMLLRFSFSHDEYSHILLIPIVSLFLVYWQRRTIFTDVESSPLPGAAGVALGLIVGGLGFHLSPSLDENDFLTWIVSAFVVFSLGAFLLCYGKRAFRKAAFPLLFLFLMVPIPTHLLDRIILWLQEGSSAVSSAGFNLLGVPVYREGFIFSLPGLSIEVAKECSGIRSTLALFITSLLAGYLLVPSKVGRVVLCLSVVPVAIFKNGLRIVTLATLSVYVNRGILDSPLHHQGGVVFFVPGLLILGLEVWLMEAYLAKRNRLSRTATR